MAQITLVPDSSVSGGITIQILMPAMEERRWRMISYNYDEVSFGDFVNAMLILICFASLILRTCGVLRLKENGKKKFKQKRGGLYSLLLSML